ncbi:Nuclear factor interleukin-3-regulated protein [Trichuris trichiura]|uniref:Nuclear factor interleukin-3-regulated protein n=1 Tax=Trichuris trichiura TaxID=36087 RepID=A0A077Z6V5_TRITR|nr:Nuclear factor interleukin-3-regulated protein [Trichuris trichiura]
MPKKDVQPLVKSGYNEDVRANAIMANEEKTRSEFSDEPKYRGRRWTTPDNGKDEHYWEKRRRNNEAAKRSRERRRLNDMATEAKLLELSEENCLLKNELETFRKILPFTNHTPLATALSAPAAPTVVRNTRPLLTRINSYPRENLAPYPANFWSCRRTSSPVAPQLYTAKAAQLASIFGYAFPTPYAAAAACGDNIMMSQLRQANVGSPKTIMEHLARATEYPCPWEVDLFGQTDSKQYLRQKLLEKQARSPDEANGAIKVVSTPGWSNLNIIQESLTTAHANNGLPTSSNLHNVADIPLNGERNSTEDLSSVRSSSSCDTHCGRSQAKNAMLKWSDPTQRDVWQPTDRYAERRRRNNEAAKRCRANRRALYESRYKRVQQLERENARIKAEATQLNQELEQLRASIARKVPSNMRNNNSDDLFAKRTNDDYDDHERTSLTRSSSDTDASTDPYSAEMDSNEKCQLMCNANVSNCRSFEKEQSVA